MDDLSILGGMLVAFFGLTAWYLNRAFLNIDKRFEAMDKKFDVVDKRFEAVDKKFDAVDKKFDAVDKKFDDFKADQNKRLDDFKDFFKELLKTEFRYIHEDQKKIREEQIRLAGEQIRLAEGQVKIQVQLTNHVTQTDQRIQNIENNQKAMQKDLSEIKDLLKKT